MRPLLLVSSQSTQSLFIATIYMPPGLYTAFLTEFPEFLSDLVVMTDNIHIFGEFNIHMEKSTDPLKKVFGAIIASMGLSNMYPDLLTATVILWT